ncbi:MAG: hypothetical protein QHH00_06715 [Methanomassiliicoccales archaeon]|jgi:hypothetical protein|nr:hypothetical protein [Methanomassiliicoccales archaeon]
MTSVSKLALLVVAFWAALVLWVFIATQDLSFLLLGLFMVIILYLIPLMMSKMNRSAFKKLAEEYRDGAIRKRIRDLSLADVGNVVTTEGSVERRSLLWLSRPRYLISDGGNSVTAMALFAPADKIEIGDRVRILGTVTRSLIKPGEITITVFEIEKIDRSY